MTNEEVQVSTFDPEKFSEDAFLKKMVKEGIPFVLSADQDPETKEILTTLLINLKGTDTAIYQNLPIMGITLTQEQEECLIRTVAQWKSTTQSSNGG